MTSLIPPRFEAYWTLEIRGPNRRDFPERDQLRFDTEVIDLLAAQTPEQPWWLGYLERGDSSNIIFPDAARVPVINGGVVMIEAGPREAIRWRSDVDWPHGSLPDVMFPRTRLWLAMTGWDDDWMSFGGSRELQQSFLSHPFLGERARDVSPNDPDATPPGHRAW